MVGKSTKIAILENIGEVKSTPILDFTSNNRIRHNSSAEVIESVNNITAPESSGQVISNNVNLIDSLNNLNQEIQRLESENSVLSRIDLFSSTSESNSISSSSNDNNLLDFSDPVISNITSSSRGIVHNQYAMSRLVAEQLKSALEDYKDAGVSIVIDTVHRNPNLVVAAAAAGVVTAAVIIYGITKEKKESTTIVLNTPSQHRIDDQMKSDFVKKLLDGMLSTLHSNQGSAAVGAALTAIFTKFSRLFRK